MAEVVAETALPGRPGEPMLALLTWRLQPVHDGVDVGGGGDLLLEQGWSLLGLELNQLEL